MASMSRSSGSTNSSSTHSAMQTPQTNVERGTKRKEKGKGIAITHQHTHKPLSLKRKAARLQDSILRDMLTLMETYGAVGFVYGVVLGSDKPVSAASHSLRSWWKEEVRFDRNGPEAVHKFMEQSSQKVEWCAHMSSMPITRLLLELSDVTLGSIISTLMQQCDPPQRQFPLEEGVAPPWWPNGGEDWWSEIELPKETGEPRVPYRKPHDLRKSVKVGVLIAILRYMAPNFARISHHVDQSRCLQNRMRAREAGIWSHVLMREYDRYYSQLQRSIMPLSQSSVFAGLTPSGSGGQSGTWNVSGATNRRGYEFLSLSRGSRQDASAQMPSTGGATTVASTGAPLVRSNPTNLPAGFMGSPGVPSQFASGSWHQRDFNFN